LEEEMADMGSFCAPGGLWLNWKRSTGNEAGRQESVDLCIDWKTQLASQFPGPKNHQDEPLQSPGAPGR
jgi:hypothetical protein